jgi:hypothetical protein
VADTVNDGGSMNLLRTPRIAALFVAFATAFTAHAAPDAGY